MVEAARLGCDAVSHPFFFFCRARLTRLTLCCCSSLLGQGGSIGRVPRIFWGISRTDSRAAPPWYRTMTVHIVVALRDGTYILVLGRQLLLQDRWHVWILQPIVLPLSTSLSPARFLLLLRIKPVIAISYSCFPSKCPVVRQLRFVFCTSTLPQSFTKWWCSTSHCSAASLV